MSQQSKIVPVQLTDKPISKQIQAPKSSGLKGISKANNLDSIPGVTEGRQKVLERNIRNRQMLSNDEIIRDIKKNYSHLSDEEMNVVIEYYIFKNMKAWPITAVDPSVFGTDAKLILKNGKYQIEYSSNIEVNTLELEGALDAHLFDPSLSTSTDMKGKGGPSVNTGLGVGASGGFNLASGQVDKSSWALGKVNGEASLNKDGLGVSIGGTGAEFTQKITIIEDDLYSYGGDVSISALSIELEAKLSGDGFEIGTPGLIGISVSGGRTELIDLNVGL